MTRKKQHWWDFF